MERTPLCLVLQYLHYFVNLVYDSSASADTSIEIPSEFTSDLRKFRFLILEEKGVSQYQGVAIVHITLSAKIRRTRTLTSVEEFRQLVHIAENKITDQLFEEIIRKIVGYRDNTHRKSPYMLCFPNMGSSSDVEGNGVSQRVRLVGLYSFSTIPNDCLPVFFLTTSL